MTVTRKPLKQLQNAFFSKISRRVWVKDNGYWSGPRNRPNASPATPMKSKLSTPKSKYSQLLPYGHPNNADNSEIPCKNKSKQMFDWHRLPLLRTLAKEDSVVGGSWFWSFWFRTGYPFQRRFLERGIIFRTHESSTFVSSHLKVFKDRLLLKIRFNALTSKSLYSCCTLERSLKNWPISRTGYEF